MSQCRIIHVTRSTMECKITQLETSSTKVKFVTVESLRDNTLWSNLTAASEPSTIPPMMFMDSTQSSQSQPHQFTTLKWSPQLCTHQSSTINQSFTTNQSFTSNWLQLQFTTHQLQLSTNKLQHLVSWLFSLCLIFNVAPWKQSDELIIKIKWIIQVSKTRSKVVRFLNWIHSNCVIYLMEVGDDEFKASRSFLSEMKPLRVIRAFVFTSWRTNWLFIVIMFDLYFWHSRTHWHFRVAW